MKILSFAFIILTTVGCSLFGIRTEETPDYTIVKKDGDFEIRKYKSHIIAKTYVEGEFKEVQNKAFRRLAGYIFGKNKSQQKIAMTAPVTQSNEKGQTIAMTAPVTQFSDAGGWVMTFSMPSKYKLEDLPEPLDKNVKFEVVPEKTMAVIGYSWLGSVKRNKKKSKELDKWLANQKDFKAISVPIYAGYDPPWTLPFLRKNEMMVEIQITK